MAANNCGFGDFQTSPEPHRPPRYPRRRGLKNQRGGQASNFGLGGILSPAGCWVKTGSDG
eukprot:1356685-Lingulodinium_polyedra.AAC.1